MGYQSDRVNEDIKRELTAILRRVKDPRVTGLLSIVRVDVAGDLSFADVRVSAVEGLEAAQRAVEGLTAAAGFIRRELGAALELRHVPQLRFAADDSIAYGAHISKTLRDLGVTPDE
ncbi:MAG: 30S ribosome-binding factor RbfA [Oscillospiraceae bacterium]|nr:30S ribosome-binding factor RbfA [Oscillospiraceae bacterium]